MGDIGHKPLLFDLKLWQIRAAIRGCNRRARPTWEATRLLGFWYANGHRSSSDPQINLQDIIQFDWDEEEIQEEISDEDIEYCQELINNENNTQSL